MKAQELFPFWNDVRTDLLRCMNILPKDQLDFRPTPALKSTGELLREVISLESYVVMRLEKPCEFKAYGWAELPDRPAIGKKLRELEAARATALEKFDRDGLEGRQIEWPNGTSLSAREAFWKCLETEVRNKAQLLTYFRIMGIDPDTRFDMTIHEP